MADTLGRATVLDDGPANGSSGRWTKFNGGVGGVLRQGHHDRLTRNITQMNVGAALREFLLEGFLVAGELGGGGVGGRSVGVNAVAAGGRLVGVSAITADMGVVVVLAAVPVPASALVAVRALAVIALVAAALVVAAVVAGGCFSAVAATPVIS